MISPPSRPPLRRSYRHHKTSERHMTDYFVDDDGSLTNKLGITDQLTLKSIEQDIVTKKSALLLSESPTVFDLSYLLYVHKTLFDDLYDFAGQLRTVDIAKPEAHVPFAYAQFLAPEAARIFDALSAKTYLVDLDLQGYIREIAALSAELNALHPFREGNGRALRLFLILLSLHAGYLLDYSRVTSNELIEADRLAFEGDHRPLLALYQKITIKNA